MQKNYLPSTAGVLDEARASQQAERSSALSQTFLGDFQLKMMPQFPQSINFKLYENLPVRTPSLLPPLRAQFPTPSFSFRPPFASPLRRGNNRQ